MLGALDGGLESLDPDDPEAMLALARLRRDCVEAKESLSFDTEATIPVALPGRHTRVRLNRSEFEAMIAPSVQDTVDATRRALRSAGVEASELAAILLAGGSSRIPLVAQVLAAEFERPIVADPHPEYSVALGAASTTAADLPSGAVSAAPAGPAPAAGPAASPATGPAELEATGAAELEATGAAELEATGAAELEPTGVAELEATGLAAPNQPAPKQPAPKQPAPKQPAPIGLQKQRDFTDLHTPADPWAAAEAAEAEAAAAHAAAAYAAANQTDVEPATMAIPAPRPAVAQPAVAQPAVAQPAVAQPTRVDEFAGISPGHHVPPPPSYALGAASIPDDEPPSIRFVPRTYTPEPPPNRRRRTLVIAGVAVLVLLAGATAAALALNHKGKPAATPSSKVTASAPPTAAALPTDKMLVRVDTGGAFGSPTRTTRIEYFTPGQPGRTVLAGTQPGDVLPRWSHDRSQIALTHNAAGTNQIFLMNADGSNRHPFVDGVTGGRVAWSIDGTKIAYMKKDSDKVSQIFVRPVGGGTAKQLTKSTDDKDDPVWSPDGQSIIYWAKRGGIKSIYELDLNDPQEPGRAITGPALGDAVDPAVSPDGTQVIFTKKVDDDNSDIWLIGTDGSNAHAVADDPAREMDPTWSPDGKWLAFVRGDYDHPKVIVERPDRSGERALTTGAAREGHPCWF